MEMLKISKKVNDNLSVSRTQSLVCHTCEDRPVLKYYSHTKVCVEKYLSTIPSQRKERVLHNHKNTGKKHSFRRREIKLNSNNFLHLSTTSRNTQKETESESFTGLHQIEKLNARLELNLWHKSLNLQKTNSRLQKLIKQYEQTEALLRDKEGLVKSIFHSSPIAMAVVDLNGNLIMSNQAMDQLFSCEVTEVAEVLFKSLGIGSNRAFTNTNLFKPLLSKECKTISFEQKFKARDCRSTVIGKTTISPVQSGERITSFVFTIEDVTFHNEAKQIIPTLTDQLQDQVAQLEQSNDELWTFCYAISHDLKAPLRAIEGFVGILRNELEDQLDDKTERIFKNITTGARKMSTLIKDLLHFSRVTNKSVMRSKIDLSMLVKGVIQDLSFMFDTKKVLWKIEDLGLSSVDASLIKQVFYNLLSNAIKFSSQHPQPIIHIGKREFEAETQYFIEDNGVGFEQSNQDKAFMVFQRLHPDEEFEGSGVGLAIVKRIIERHRGRIWVESQERKGSTFYFTLNGK